MARFAPTVPRIGAGVWLVVAHDGEGSAAIRDRELEAHLEYVEKHNDAYLVCGPLRDAGGDALVGSFFLVSADNEASARGIVENDPYYAAGTYASVEIRRAVPAAGRLLGGVIWESADEIRAAAT